MSGYQNRVEMSYITTDGRAGFVAVRRSPDPFEDLTVTVPLSTHRTYSETVALEVARDFAIERLGWPDAAPEYVEPLPEHVCDCGWHGQHPLEHLDEMLRQPASHYFRTAEGGREGGTGA